MGGKRMRPALLLMACDLFGGDVEAALPPALAIEVFHNFTLMHDDIMDNAPSAAVVLPCTKNGIRTWPSLSAM
jgi:geranylgeranyl pyrophosphate synthase